MNDGKTNCETCPALSVTLEPGATDINACLCQAAYFREGPQCLPCPRGAFKPGEYLEPGVHMGVNMSVILRDTGCVAYIEKNSA
jgi:hypothetical protein